MGSKLILMGLCFLAHPIAINTAFDLNQEPSAELQKYTYTGRDDNGRPTWSYGYE